MIKAVIVLAILGCAVAQYERDATILRSGAENLGDGNFRYNYETSNGITAEATGFIKNPGVRSEDQIQVIQGSYSYYGPDGVLYTVSYIADENGFQPVGSHLPALPVRAAAQPIYRPNPAYRQPYNQRPYQRK